MEVKVNKYLNNYHHRQRQLCITQTVIMILPAILVMKREVPVSEGTQKNSIKNIYNLKQKGYTRVKQINEEENRIQKKTTTLFRIYENYTVMGKCVSTLINSTSVVIECEQATVEETKDLL